MFWIVIPFIIVVGLSLNEAAAQQQCNGDPIDGFTCTDGSTLVGLTGAVFTPSTALAPSPLLRRGIEELLQEEEETGGGASADGPGFGFFVNGLAAFTDIDKKRELGSDSDTFGVSLGTDYGGERFVVGAALDYSHEDTNFDENAGKTDTDEFGLQLIGIAYPVGDLYVAGTARFAYDDYDTKRDSGAKGSPEGVKVQLAGGPGYDFDLGNGFVVGVSGLLRWEWTHIDSYKESGADATDLNLDYDDDDIYMLTSILELNGQKSFSVPFGVLVPEVVFRYLHEFENDPRTINADVIGSPGNSISYRTNKPDRDYINLGGALTTVLPGGLALFVDYHAELAHNYREEHVVNFGLRTSLDYLFGLAGSGGGS